jgi:hypothetical protein
VPRTTGPDCHILIPIHHFRLPLACRLAEYRSIQRLQQWLEIQGELGHSVGLKRLHICDADRLGTFDLLLQRVRDASGAVASRADFPVLLRGAATRMDIRWSAGVWTTHRTVCEERASEPWNGGDASALLSALSVCLSVGRSDDAP